MEISIRGKNSFFSGWLKTVLGSNFLRKHAAQLDFSTGELWIPGQDTIAIQKESTVKEVSALAIRSQEQVSVHLQELFSRSEALDEEQRFKFLSLLQKYQDIFASTSDQVEDVTWFAIQLIQKVINQLSKLHVECPYIAEQKSTNSCVNECISAVTGWRAGTTPILNQFPSYQENKFGCFIQDAREENDQNCNLIGRVLIWLRNAWSNWYIGLFVHQKQNRR